MGNDWRTFRDCLVTGSLEFGERVLTAPRIASTLARSQLSQLPSQ